MRWDRTGTGSYKKKFGFDGCYILDADDHKKHAPCPTTTVKRRREILIVQKKVRMRAIYPRHLNPIRWWWCMLRIETWWWWRWWWCSSSSYREGVKQTRWEHCDTSEIQTVKARGRGGGRLKQRSSWCQTSGFCVCMYVEKMEETWYQRAALSKKSMCVSIVIYTRSDWVGSVQRYRESGWGVC